MVPWLVDNVPTPTNSIAVLVVLCVFLFGGMAIAKFMERREDNHGQ
jgi:Sec-independent protein secretion pathway component TatC